MDVSHVDIKIIENFDLHYTIAESLFEVEPMGASAKMQKKIRKWFEKTCIEGEAYPTGVMWYFDKTVSDESFISFMKSCHDYIQMHGTQKKQQFDKASSDLPEDVKAALWALLEPDVCFNNFRKVGTDAQIDVEYGAGYDRTLTFINVSGIPEGQFDCLSFENGSLTKQEGVYCLNGEAQDYDGDTCIPFSVRFTEVTVRLVLSRTDMHCFMATPWEHLQSIASDILDKYFLPGDCLNTQEKELLPLIVEISKLSFWVRIPAEFQNDGYSRLACYMGKYGYKELLPLLKKLEKTAESKKSRIVQKLIDKLNRQKYAPLWRELFDLLTASQAGYPDRVSACCNKELLVQTRQNIQAHMESNGYSGQYPSFHKTGAIPGIRLAEAYGMSYFVGLEKRAVYHVHCTEEYCLDHLMIQFMCGTELLRNNEAMGDIYSCTFNANGRRFFQTLSYESEYVDASGETQTDDLEKLLQIAVKKSQLQRLTKEEQKVLWGENHPLWTLFFFIFIVMGGLFAIFMTVGFMLLAVLACLLVGQPQTIPSMLVDIPWWPCFVFCWVAFGGAMGLVTVLIKRK